MYTFLLGICVSTAFGQFSPGPLTNAHADLEGMSNCTQCHDIGNSISEAKCLECHDIIKSLIDNNRGYHASQEAKTQSCIDCHSEHNGRKFEISRFDQENFDHTLTGYDLQGQHGKIECRDCHSSENIANIELKSRPNTFLGLEEDCVSCHRDYHQNTLGNDCVSCHGFDSFRPADKFDHDETAYKLTGAHTSVSCEECHPIGTLKGQEYQAFSDIAFNDCVNCHNDPHNQLPGSCNSCHVTESFTNNRYLSRFNHNLTGFTLKGSHSDVNCFDCHGRTSDPANIFQDQKGISENNCVACHEDVHEGRFGDDCASCHNEISFLELNEGFEFDHDITDFPLEGLHVEVDCKECHSTSFRDPMDHASCMDCHDDYHEGQFVQSDPSRDCDACHSLYDPFTTTSFGFSEHEQTDFPLEGSHLATPCFACHLDEEKWNFTSIGSRCVDCHDNIHEDYISAEFYPDEDCTTCHNTDMWSLVSFDHNATEWPLEGQHQLVDCRQCHFEETEDGAFQQFFVNLSTECMNCHENIHGNQFAIEGTTDCKRCHSTEGWGPEAFDHSNTAFPLEGKHAELDCDACHNTFENNIRVFTIEKFECIDCHS